MEKKGLSSRGFVVALLLLVIFLISLPPLEALCNGAYNSSSLTIINRTVTCRDGYINITGAVSVGYPLVTFFDSRSTVAAYVITANAATISRADPDGVNTTPSQYTGDWDIGTSLDPRLNYTFQIAAEVADHDIQIFTNDSDASFRQYFIDVDNNIYSGCSVFNSSNCPSWTEGSDIGFGIVGGSAVIACWNATSEKFQALTASPTACNATWDSTLAPNFTVYYTNLGNAYEIVIVTNGTWINKPIYDYGTGTLPSYTTFINTTVNSGALQIINATVHIVNQSITINPNASFDIQASHLQFNFSGFELGLTFRSDSHIRINVSNITTNNTGNYTSVNVSTSNYTFIHTNFSYLNHFAAGKVESRGTGGVIYNNTFQNCNGRCLALFGFHTGLNFSKNNFYGSSDVFLYNVSSVFIGDNSFDAQKSGESGNCINFYLYGQSVNMSGDGVCALHLQDKDRNNYLNNSIFLNLNISWQLNDSDNGGLNTMVYANSTGRINWTNKANLTTSAVSLDIYPGSQVFIGQNLIGIGDSVDMGALNSSATLTFFGLTGFGNLNPTIKKNGVTCSNPTCNITGWENTGGSLTIQVQGFSNHTAENGGNDANIPEFSDYALVFILITVIGGFLGIRRGKSAEAR